MEESMKQLKAFYGFNEDYFKVGQLIKVIIKNYVGEFLEKKYGFIKEIEKEKIKFIFVDKKGDIKEECIVLEDLNHSALDIKIEIIGE